MALRKHSVVLVVVVLVVCLFCILLHLLAVFETSKSKEAMEREKKKRKKCIFAAYSGSPTYMEKSTSIHKYRNKMLKHLSIHVNIYTRNFPYFSSTKNEKKKREVERTARRNANDTCFASITPV